MIPPTIPAHEASVLSALMAYTPEAAPKLRGRLAAEEFSHEGASRLYRALFPLWDAHGALDLVMISAEARRLGILESLGGDAGLTALWELAGTAATVMYHLQQVCEAAEHRRLVAGLDECAELALRDGRPVAALRAEIAERVARLCTARTEEEFFTTRNLADLLEAPEIPGVRTGFSPLDECLDGLQPEHLIVIAGRPGTGKTSFAVQVAEHVTRDADARVLFMSCEMSPREIAKWFLALVAGVRRSDVAPAVIQASRAAFERRGLIVRAPSAPRIEAVQDMVRAHVAAHQIELVIVDYLGKLTAPKTENRTQEVGCIARGLKAIAKSLHLPVLALHQLNRDSERRAVPRPQLADLRDSGEIEQEADAVGFLWTSETEKPADLPMHLTLEKNRHGTTGEWRFTFRRPFGRFEKRKEEGP